MNSDVNSNVNRDVNSDVKSIHEIFCERMCLVE